jgi:8-oxo-dGTP diphosphatase
LEDIDVKIGRVYWHPGETRQMAEDEYVFCPVCGEHLEVKTIDRRSRKACVACGFIHFKNPSPTVSLVIIEDHKILLGKRASHPGQGTWATPSGYIEFSEDFLTTAIREAKEETCLDVEIVEILEVTDSFFPPYQHFLNIYVQVKINGGEVSASDDLVELEWFPLHEPLPEMAFQEDIDLIESLKTRDATQ